MNLRNLTNRAVMSLITLFGVMTAVFVLLRIVPGDPIAMMAIGESSPEDIARLRAQYGLDKTIIEQFAVYLKDIFTGNFGASISLREDSLKLVLERLPATLELSMLAMLLAVAFGVSLALSATYWRGTFIEPLIDFTNSVALAIPEFIWALLLILLFGVILPWLPLSGRMDPAQDFDFQTNFYFLESIYTLNGTAAWNIFMHTLLPSIALAIPLMAIVARVLKSSLSEVGVQDYIMLARVKGFSRAKILITHALPNALLPTVTLTGVHFVFLVGGTVLIELLFAYPGIGNLLYSAVINRDFPLIQCVTLVFACLFILMNMAIDLLHAAMNVRAR